MIKQGIDPFTQASFGFGNRLGRAVWGIGLYFLFPPNASISPLLSSDTVKNFWGEVGPALSRVPQR